METDSRQSRFRKCGHDLVVSGNWLIVFQPDGHDWLERAGRFLATTAFSAFILQNSILYLTTYVWSWPVKAALFVLRTLRLQGRLNEHTISRNICKALAVSAGLIDRK